MGNATKYGIATAPTLFEWWRERRTRDDLFLERFTALRFVVRARLRVLTHADFPHPGFIVSS